MKAFFYAILAVVIVSLPQIVTAKDEKAAVSKRSIKTAQKMKNPLITETNVQKVQVLVISNDYKKVTENDYVAIVQHLYSLAKGTDISTDEGKMDAAVYYTSLQNFRNLFEKQDFDRAVFDLEWLKQKAKSYYDDKLSKDTQESYLTRIENAGPWDDKTVKEDYKRRKSAANK